MTRSRSYNPTLLRAAEFTLYLFALASLTYAAVVAPQQGKDLKIFWEMAAGWTAGVPQHIEGSFYGPPPYAVVLFFPLSLLSFEAARMSFLVVNVAAIGASLFILFELWGKHWQLRTRLFLSAFFLSLAPTRVTLRVGQISLLVSALLLGALLARKRHKKLLSGALLGLSLIKYPLTLPFFLYFAWRREWKIIAAAVSVVAVLTVIYALQLGISPIDVTRDYVSIVARNSLSAHTHFEGSTEIGPLVFLLTGGNESLTTSLSIAMVLAGLVCIGLFFYKRPEHERIHLAVLSMYSLWFVYHRTYDSVICILTAALLVDFILSRKFVGFSITMLSVLGLFVISIPGFLIERLHLSADELSKTSLGLLGLHSERLLVLSVFCSLLVLLWKAGSGKKTKVAETDIDR